MNDYQYSPISALHDDLLAHVFSFVGGGVGKKQRTGNIAPTVLKRPEGPVRLMEIQEAAHLQFSSMAVVCKRWNQTCKNNLALILGPIKAAFNTLDSPAMIDEMMTWMIHYKLRIGSLYFYAPTDSVDQIIDLLIQCDTSDLQKMAVNSTSRNLHDTIAEQCPALEELFTGFDAYQFHETGKYSNSLFSMPSLRCLHLSVWDQPDAASRIRTLDEDPALPLHHLIALQELRVYSTEWRGPFVIKSDSLEKVDICDATNVDDFACHCPKLKAFYCKGGGRLHPKDESPWSRIGLTANGIGLTADGCRVTTAGEISFFELVVPDSCVVSVKHPWLE